LWIALLSRPPRRHTLFPYTTLFRSSQKALGKYILVVVALFTLQVMLGGFTAHYTVEGDGFYGLNTTEWLPYSLARTWHIQAAMLDRKSTRLNSSHVKISYAVFCLKK